MFACFLLMKLTELQLSDLHFDQQDLRLTIVRVLISCSIKQLVDYVAQVVTASKRKLHRRLGQQEVPLGVRTRKRTRTGALDADQDP